MLKNTENKEWYDYICNIWVAAIFLLLCLLGSAFLDTQHISIEIQMKLMDAIRTTSSIIFAVMGFWYSFLDNKIILNNLKSSLKTLDRVTLVMFWSVLTLLYLLTAHFLAPFLQAYLSLEFKVWGLRLSYGLLGFFLFSQLISLILILVPIIESNYIRSLQLAKKEKDDTDN